jgi:hypothetical protein
MGAYVCRRCVLTSIVSVLLRVVQPQFSKVVEAIGMLRDELDERVTAIRSVQQDSKREEIAQHQVDYFTRKMMQVCRMRPTRLGWVGVGVGE